MGGVDFGEHTGDLFEGGFAVMKAANDFVVFLRIQGYSDRAIEEICKWYVCSTTGDSSGKLPLEQKN